MDSVIEFISNADNRAILTWIGSILTAVAGAAWVVIKYFLSRDKAAPKPAATKEDLSVSVGRGVGIGGNARATIGSVRIGFGLGALFWVGLLLLALSLVGGRAWSGIQAKQARMPAFSLELDCLPDSDLPIHQLSKEEAALFARFKSFAEKNDGATVYLRLRINSDIAANPRGCSRIGSRDDKRKKIKTSKRDRDPPDDAPMIYIDSTPPAARRDSRSEVEKHGRELLAISQEKWGEEETYFYVPDYAQIPENGIYKTDGAAAVLVYDGPFVVHFQDTRIPVIYFEPVKDPSSAVRTDVDCLRRHDQLSFIDRYWHSCF